MVDRNNNDSIGVVDWEYASFVPKAFVPIHVKISAGYNLDIEGLDKQSVSYAKRLGQTLEQAGFTIPHAWSEYRLAQTQAKK